MNYPLTLEQYIAQMPMQEAELARMGGSAFRDPPAGTCAWGCKAGEYLGCVTRKLSVDRV